MIDWLGKYLDVRTSGLLEPADTLVIWRVYVRDASRLVAREDAGGAYPVLTSAAPLDASSRRAYAARGVPW